MSLLQYMISLLWIAFFFSARNVNSALLLSTNEMIALQDIYNSTRGTRWKYGIGAKWNFTKNKTGDFIHNPCSERWFGITCSQTRSNYKESHPFKFQYGYYYDDIIIKVNYQFANVEKIYLMDAGLNGTIPNTIGSFTFLTHLNLARFGIKLIRFFVHINNSIYV